MSKYSQTLSNAADRLVGMAEDASKLPVIKRAEPATQIMLGLTAVVRELVAKNAELSNKIKMLEPYADE
ncbi:hypothetical protein [Planktotalea arctica]|uniref:hypothetical protein n=2 Tax=Planktotalea arctica TaxID=1481893 RepID=UPI003219399B